MDTGIYSSEEIKRRSKAKINSINEDTLVKVRNNIMSRLNYIT